MSSSKCVLGGGNSSTKRSVDARRRPPSSFNSRKRKYLMTDEGFLAALVANLFMMVAAMGFVFLIRPYREYVINAYFAINERMMAMANHYAWWSILGLLSSSCCALQILLNALSFGCSGINGLLGPLRPTFVAFTILSIVASWVLASPRPYQWRPTALSTGLSTILTLMPEFIDLHTRRRAQRRRLCAALDGGKLDDLLLYPNIEKRTKKTCMFYFHLPTLGCASCVAHVSSLLDSLDSVVNHRVIFEDGIVEVEVVSSDNANHDLLWHQVSSELSGAGFPNRVEVKGTKKDR